MKSLDFYEQMNLSRTEQTRLTLYILHKIRKGEMPSQKTGSCYDYTEDEWLDLYAACKETPYEDFRYFTVSGFCLKSARVTDSEKNELSMRLATAALKNQIERYPVKRNKERSKWVYSYKDLRHYLQEIRNEKSGKERQKERLPLPPTLPSDTLHDPDQISNGCAISVILAAAVILIAITACVTHYLCL